MNGFDMTVFRDGLGVLSGRIAAMSGAVTNEESTKMALIVPFFRVLGYDVFNPLEFVPEFTADIGIKKGEKVDYAIMRDGRPVVIIEAKAAGTQLDAHMSQLFRYFNTVTPCVAILTNGTEYRFYTDLDTPNRMDTAPFLRVDLSGPSDEDVRRLAMFHRDNFDPDRIRGAAFDWKYGKILLDRLEAEAACPSDAFLSAMMGQDVPAAMLERLRGPMMYAMSSFRGTAPDGRKKAEARTERAASGPSVVNQDECIDWWTSFLGYVSRDAAFAEAFGHVEPCGGPCLDFPTGWRSCHASAMQCRKENELRVGVVIPGDGDLFHWLSAQRDDIEDECGMEFEWEEGPDGCRITHAHAADFDAGRSEAFEWLAGALVRMYGAFSNYME